MKKTLWLMALLCILFIPMHSLAEGNNILSMEELTIQVMPEFAYHPNDKKKDHQPLLIGYQGSMVNNSAQPQKGQIEIPLPMNEKNFRIGYVADYSIDLTKAYEIEYMIDREQGTISWTTSEEIGPNERYKFVVEFYTDGLKVNKYKKSLTYHFKNFADSGLVNVAFTKPSKAKNWRLTPAPVEKQTHADGDDIFSYHYQGMKAGEEKTFTLKYERSETKPTMELIKDPSLDKKNNENRTNKIAIGAFSGVSLLSAGAITILIRKRKKER